MKNLINIKYTFLLFVFISIGVRLQAQGTNMFKPGQLWYDNHLLPINAHGGGILYYKNRYYWFGEHKLAGEKGNKAYIGVHCYSSADLYNWKDEGISLSVSKDSTHALAGGCILERPKVIYNDRTGKFVMWFHLEKKGKGYSSAMCGVAVSDRVTGPYSLDHTERPDKNAFPLNYRQYSDGSDSLLKRDLKIGQMSRDMNLFKDDDGKAYLIYTSEENRTVHISRLSSDYITTTGNYVRVFPDGYMEAAAIFKNEGKYYFVASGCTGWAPNAARSAVADSLFGEWIELGNPCRGVDSALTFHSQSTFVLPVAGKKGAFIFMADRWNPQEAIDGRYLWLPVRFENKGFSISWKDQWNLNDFHTDTVYPGNGKVKQKVSYTIPGKELKQLALKIKYKSTAQGDLFLYLLRPQNKKKMLPAIIYFFGGGWVTGDVEYQIPHAAWFRDKGIIAITADYRIKSKHGTTPMEAISDAKSAVRFVRSHAGELGIDPNRIIVGGGSAGGHLAVCTMIQGGDETSEDLHVSSKANALVLHNPVLGVGFGQDFFKAHPEFLPINQVKSGWPPTVISCGTKDRTTPFAGAEKFTELMKNAGNVCVLIPVKDADHSCDYPVSNPNFLPTLTQMSNFLKQYHFIP